MRNNLLKLFLVVSIATLFGCSQSSDEESKPAISSAPVAESGAEQDKQKEDKSSSVKVDFALNCVGQKNGQQAEFFAYKNEAKFTYQTPGYFIQKNLSKVSTDSQKYTYNIDSEWTTFEGPLFLKRISGKRIELIRDTLELNYYYDDGGRDPFSCSKVSDDQAQSYFDKANEMLNNQKNELASSNDKAEQELKQRETEQLQRNKI